MAKPPTLAVFISSPSDVQPERELAERVIARLDNVWRAHVRLRAELWERKHYQAAIGFQEAIGAMQAFDVVLGIIWKRVGSELAPDLFKRADGSAYESGTVFELETAIAASEDGHKPAVFILRKTEEVRFSAKSVREEELQHQRLNAWWDRTMRDAEGYFRRGYQSFETSEEFETQVSQILEDYLRDNGLIPSGAAWDVATRGSPYPGLIAYDGDYADVFFGRALAVAAALDDLKAAALRETPALFIVGPSGSGKSSLARAGLVPQVAAGYLEGVDFWRELLLEPARDPMAAFAQRLYGVLPELAGSPQKTPEAFAALAHGSPESAVESVKWGLEQAARSPRGARAPVGRLLITYDQFETLLGADQQKPMAALLRMLVEGEAAWLIATLRSDRYADLQLDPDLLQLRRRGALFDLPPPGPSEVADIVKGPAHAAALTFEERDGEPLSKTLVAAVSGADALPLLQMTLARLFDARKGAMLTFDAYEDMGGLEGAIAAHAETVFGTVSPAGQAKLDTLLQALVADIDETGRLTIRTPRREAVATDEASRELVDKLTEARLLVSAGDELRIAHEALLRRWRRASESPALQPEAVRLRRQIEPAFDVWRRTGLDSDLLQPGSTALAAADAIVRDHPGAFPAALADYVAQSAAAAAERIEAEKTKAQAETRRARRRGYIFAGFAGVFAVVAVLAVWLGQQANHSLGLALLTKAEQLLVEERPTTALVVAAAAGGAGFHNPFVISGGLDPSSDDGVRARTIAEIAQAARAAPVWGIQVKHAVSAVALSGDGKQFAVGEDDGSAFVEAVGQNGQRGRHIDLVGHTATVNAVKFSPDGREVATASNDGTVKLWSLAGAAVRTLCAPGGVNDMAFDPKGRFIVGAATNGVVVWDAATGGPVKTPQLGGAKSNDWGVVDFSADGGLLAASDADGVVRVFDTTNWSQVAAITTGQIDLVSVAFSPDSHRLAVASVHGSVTVWDLPSAGAPPAGRLVQTIAPRASKLWKVRYSPDGRFLAVAAWDGTVRLLDTATFQSLGTMDGNDLWVSDIAFSKDSASLLSGGRSGTVRLWDLRSIRPMVFTVRDSPMETIQGRYSPDGSKFVTAGRDGAARLYDVDAQGGFHYQCKVDHAAWLLAIAFSPDGRRVISAGTAKGATNNEIEVWDTDGATAGDCRKEAPIPVGGAYVTSLAWNPANATQIAWGAGTGAIWTMNIAARGAPVQLPKTKYLGATYALAFSPDGRTLASTGADGEVLLWNARTGALAQTLADSGRSSNALRFIDNGQLLASAGDGDQVFIWRVGASSPLVQTLSLTGGASAMAVSRDGQLLAAGGDGRSIVMWSTTSWKKVFQLDALAGARGVFDFSPKGDLAFDGEDGLVRVIPAAAHPPPIEVTDIHYVLSGANVYFDRQSSAGPQPAQSSALHGAGGSCPASG